MTTHPELFLVANLSRKAGFLFSGWCSGEGSLNWGFLSVVTSELHFMTKFEFHPLCQWPGATCFTERIPEEEAAIANAVCHG